MLSPRLTNCVECTTIPVLLNEIDCKIAQLAGNLYNNIVFMLNQPVQANVMIDLLNYRRILTFKYCNPDYAGCFTIPMIASKVKILTVNNKPAPRPSCGTTTTSTTASPTTSTTSTSSSTTTSTTTNSGLIYSISTDQSMSCAGYGNSILLTPGNLFSPFCFQDTYYGNVSIYNNNTVVYIKDALSENVRAYTTWGTYLQSYGPCVNCSTITTSSTSTSTSSSTTTTTTTSSIGISIGLDISTGCSLLSPIPAVIDGVDICNSSTITSLGLPFSDYIGLPSTYVSFFASDGSGNYVNVINPPIGEYVATISGACETCPS